MKLRTFTPRRREPPPDVYEATFSYIWLDSFVDDLNSTDDLDPNNAPPMMCLVEEPKGGMGTDERVMFAMIAISPSTGDVVWDEFEGETTAFC